MDKLINKFKKLPDDRIGQDIYIAFEWSTIEGQPRKLTRIYLGSKTNGPMLQWFRPSITPEGEISSSEYTIEFFGIQEEIKPWHLYTGYGRVEFRNGAWTNLYSRGNFGKKYAFGGNWSGHNKNLHPRLMKSPISDKNIELLKVEGINEPMVLPDGIKGDISVADVDCSGSWTIWYTNAKIALSERLSMQEINQSSLPSITKQHLLKNETQEVLDCLADVIEAYDL